MCVCVNKSRIARSPATEEINDESKKSGGGFRDNEIQNEKVGRRPLKQVARLNKRTRRLDKCESINYASAPTLRRRTTDRRVAMSRAVENKYKKRIGASAGHDVAQATSLCFRAARGIYSNVSFFSKDCISDYDKTTFSGCEKGKKAFTDNNGAVTR